MITHTVVGLAAVLVLTACPRDEDPVTTEPTSSPSGRPSTTAAAGCTADQRMDTYSLNGVVHTDHPGYQGPLAPREAPQYTVNPPSGGDHLSRATGPGVYQGANVPPDGNLVHSLEHGYVIVWFKPEVADGDKAVLQSVFDDLRRDTLLVERIDMPTPVVATAWGRRLLCDRVDAKVLSDFVKAARNQAPEKVPH